MEPVLTYFGIVLTAGYLAFLFSLFTGVGRLRRCAHERRYPVSIVVAARNEEDTIGYCLDALLAQDYPAELLDIIIVNDRSEDATGEILDAYRRSHPCVSVIDVTNAPEEYSPKKYALAQGIAAARGDIICTTDADCAPPPGWVRAIVRCFADDVGMVAGFSPLIVQNGGRFFTDFLYIDSLSLAIVAAGGIGWGTGWTCSGRNLAYRKAVFHEVGGYESVKDQISGDDDLLMHLVLTKTSWKLRFAAGADATIPSKVVPGKRRYARQRTRHASKFRVYPAHVKTAALAVFLFYCAIGLYPLYMLAALQALPVYGVMLAGKFLAELPVLVRGSRVLAGRFDFVTFLKAFFIHPVLIVVFSILGARGRFTWKGREFNQH